MHSLPLIKLLIKILRKLKFNGFSIQHSLRLSLSLSSIAALALSNRALLSTIAIEAGSILEWARGPGWRPLDRGAALEWSDDFEPLIKSCLSDIDDMMDFAIIQGLSAAGRHQACLQACQVVLQANPEETYAYKYSGKSLLALKQFEKARQCLLKAHQLDGSDPETVNDIGNIFYIYNNYAEAIRHYKAALSIDQDYAPAIFNFGLIAKQYGNLGVAEQLVKWACNLDQSVALYHTNLSNILFSRGKYHEALEEQRKGSGMIKFNLDEGFSVTNSISQ